MIKSIILAAFLLAFANVQAADSLMVTLNSNHFEKSDTIKFNCIYKYTEKKNAASTLNVWIENLETNKKWKFRYPLVNGKISANLIINEDLPAGKYAMNYLVQNQFFEFNGKVKDYNPKSKGLVYLMLTKNKSKYINDLQPNADGTFKLPRLEFEDSASFVFSPMSKRRDDLFINTTTPLDSAFTPVIVHTEIITIGSPIYVNATDSTIPYIFNATIFKKSVTLEAVIVKSVTKKKVQKFDEEYSTGLFSGKEAKFFDGIEGTDISSSTDVFRFLQGRIAGLSIGYDALGNLSVTWRGSHVALYLDEFRIETDSPPYINPSDVAMIKVYPPGSGGPNNKGAIAIYTKRGDYTDSSSTRNYYFIVRGFTPAESVWK